MALVSIIGISSADRSQLELVGQGQLTCVSEAFLYQSCRHVDQSYAMALHKIVSFVISLSELALGGSMSHRIREGLCFLRLTFRGSVFEVE